MARFKNTEDQTALDNLGFTFFHFLKTDELQQLKELYQRKYHGNSIEGFLHASHNSNPFEVNKRISDSIADIVSPALDRHFENYRHYVSHFMVKKRGQKSMFHLHQDWNVVDEEKYSSLHIWIPLELAGPENGGLFFLPYVHRHVKLHRSGSFGIPFAHPDEKIKQWIVPVRLMPEDAIVFHNATFHGSYPNTSSADRVAFVVTIVSKDAPTVYYHKNNDLGKCQVYSLSETEILKYLPVLEKGIIPAPLKLLSEHPLPLEDASQISSSVIAEIYQRKAPRDSTGAVARPRIRRIIRSDTLEDTINQQGYALLPFLNSEEVNFLLKKFKEYFPVYSHLPPRFTSHESIDSKSRTEIFHLIESVVKPYTDRFFCNYKMTAALFYMKQRQNTNDTGLHFDPTLLINEHLEPHLGIWCPLIDVNEENGTIQVIPGSHRWGAFISNPLTVKSPLDKYRSELENKLISIPMKAGEALLWDDRIAHSSTVNRSPHDRYTFVLRFTHKDARLASFFGTPDGQVRVYSQQDKWYLHPDWDHEKTPPKIGTLQGVIEKYEPELDIGQINRLYAQSVPER